MTTREGTPWKTDLRTKRSPKSGGSAEKPLSPKSTPKAPIDMGSATSPIKSLHQASVRRTNAARAASPPAVIAAAPYRAGHTGRAMTPGTTVCGDCLTTPCPDQRSAAKDGRCRHCTRTLYRDRRKRARQAEVEVYEVQAPTLRNWSV
jgi:hypothetical protein